MRTRWIHGLAIVALVAGGGLALARTQSHFGPIASVTGAPPVGGKSAEWDCTPCHFGDGNLNRPGGALEILDVPDAYTPGQTYALRVRLSSDSTALLPSRQWGFQLTAVRRADGEGVGTFTLYDPDTLQIVAGSGEFATREYVEHTFEGTRAGLVGPVQWTFAWQAPLSDVGPIDFFAAGNAADGMGDMSGDLIYTGRDSTLPSGTAGVENPVAAGVSLSAPRPNPARGPVTFAFAVPRRGRVDLAVYDVRGRRVRTLESGWREAGAAQARWDGRADDGVMAPSGAYFARLRVDGVTVSRKLVLGR